MKIMLRMPNMTQPTVSKTSVLNRFGQDSVTGQPFEHSIHMLKAIWEKAVLTPLNCNFKRLQVKHSEIQVNQQDSSNTNFETVTIGAPSQEVLVAALKAARFDIFRTDIGEAQHHLKQSAINNLTQQIDLLEAQ